MTGNEFVSLCGKYGVMPQEALETDSIKKLFGQRKARLPSPQKLKEIDRQKLIYILETEFSGDLSND